jgi:hypothetical protein
MKYLKFFESWLDQQKQDFISYFLNFYDDDDLFEGKLSKELIDKYLDFFIKRRMKLFNWGNGDSFDREVFRDFLLVKLGLRSLNEVEYKNQVRDYLSDFEISVTDYNL